jgi:hypothetical protein
VDFPSPDGAQIRGLLHTKVATTLLAVWPFKWKGGREQADMPSCSLLPRPQGVGKKKNQSGYFIAAPRTCLGENKNLDHGS